ncbi:MAG: hypothetical protein ACI8UD_003782, partial [Planctomycetota bacterium]
FTHNENGRNNREVVPAVLFAVLEDREASSLRS